MNSQHVFKVQRADLRRNALSGGLNSSRRFVAARLSSLADCRTKQRFFVGAMAPRCPCLASASETDGARNAFSFLDPRVCVDEKFGRA